MSHSRLDLSMELHVPRLPTIDQTYFPLKISQFVNVGKFWVQYDEETVAGELQAIQSVLNRGKLLAHTGPIEPGDILAAPYSDDGHVYRARVLRLLPRDQVEVSYIDYGSMGKVNVSNLRSLPEAGGVCRATPPLAMLCSLAEVAPPPLLESHSHWTAGAAKLFSELTHRGPLMAKIYSVAQGVVHIELLAEGGNININQELIRAGLAIAAEETYESKLNHDIRQSVTELNMAQIRAYNREQLKFAFKELREFDSPSAKDCYTAVSLKGPFSPLESTLHNLMYGSRDTAVQIEWNSINSVLLDTEPQRVYERLLVAAEVGQNEQSSKLTLRHTTLMPNVPGLPAIIALLFCPTAELRRGVCGSRYASALCGLGADAAGAPHFPEHDLLVSVDADLDSDDVSDINHIRYLMDYTMICSDNQDEESRRNLPALIRDVLLRLLMKRRKHREPEAIPKEWEWHSVPEDELMEIAPSELTNASEVYPLHVPQELRPIPREKLEELKREVDKLHLLVARSSISSNAERACPLCGTAPLPAHALRIHLASASHRDKEADFNIFNS
ncbi:hypothetical protein MSG28_006931 [Choristoneura fumiferana]|uniref:Uncharacterized protein n=2 Tax=Choristoneura fumiferana TaxID=7141 RepID=A0ACC0JLN6_CHOFU|nr:hypothetical protein MSG28_006931 [Choristoneura fumiferana]